MLSRHDDLALKYVLNVPNGRKDDAEMPLVIVLHGRGADANDLADVAPAIDAGYRFVFPNAPKPFEPYRGMTMGWTWFDGWPPTPATIADSRAKITTFLDQILERYPTPDGKLILAGFSQGGLMSLDIGFRTEHELAGIVVMSGALYEDGAPDLKTHGARPVLIVHGEADEVIPVNAARRARRVLEEHGIATEYHEFAMGHWVTPDSIAVVAEFIARCLGAPIA